MKNEIRLEGGGVLCGEINPPGDKSISHRSVILSSLAQGKSAFRHFLTSEDCLDTLEAFKKMGVRSSLAGDVLTVEGVGLDGLRAPASDLDMGNSGTSTRLLLGILAAQPFQSRLFGDSSLSGRPMDRVVNPLRLMGAKIEGREGGRFLPLEVSGKKLSGIRYELPVPSAQVKSCLLLAGLFAEGRTEVVESLPTRDHTERAFQVFGAPYKRVGSTHEISCANELRPASYAVPGDISSAAFFIVGTLISKGSEIRLKQVGLNPTRTGLLRVLKRMGAKIRIEHEELAGEPSGDLVVSASDLKGTEVLPEEIPSLIDEIPILTLAAACAEGETVIRGAGELRVKESDRISGMARNLKAVGASLEETEDGFRIQGRESLQGGIVDSYGDHRVAMTFVIASLVSRSEITVKGLDCIATSYPSFFEHFDSLRK